MKKIYLNEYNIPIIDNTFYLPYSSGLLQAYAQTFPKIKENYIFQPILFKRDTVDNIVVQYDNPSVVGFSVSMWNYNLSLEVSKKIKEKFPTCLIVFGGPSIQNDISFLKHYPHIDVVVYGEGERVFSDILLKHFDGKNIAGVYTQDTPIKNLDIFPSPYTKNIFSKLIKNNPKIKFQTIIETNRGCPFSCTYCFWGDYKTLKKISYHSIDYINADANWIGRNNISYVFCSDANFGMFKRDIGIAQIYSDTKQKYKYPEKFRVCYGKNAEESIFQTAKILSNANLAKVVTMSLQSNNKEVLDSIKRKNIKTKTFSNLQQRYLNARIPTYTELILGLPNETYKSFVNGLQKTLDTTTNNQIFIYHCQILPNTKLSDDVYQQQYGIIFTTIPLAEVHGVIRSKKDTIEFEKIVIGTNTMSVIEWQKCAILSWIVQMFHGLKVGNLIVEWLKGVYDINYMDIYEYLANSNIIEIKEFHRIAHGITKGKQRCQTDKRFGNIYYEPEELVFLSIAYNKEVFYNKLKNSIKKFLISQDYKYNNTTLKTIIEQQKQIIPEPNDFNSSQEFATSIILYNRKSNTTTRKK